ncbi:hypothetical protein SEVIR_7G211001v4 [Setaria viridis]
MWFTAHIAVQCQTGPILPVPQPSYAPRQRKSQFGVTPAPFRKPAVHWSGEEEHTGGDAVTIRTRDLPPFSASPRPFASREIARRDARIAWIRPRNRRAAASRPTCAAAWAIRWLR